MQKSEFYCAPDKKIAYLKLHKCGCTSLASYISSFHVDTPKRPLWSSKEFNFGLVTKDHRELQDYFKFTFVRNPYDRFLAFYNNWIMNPVRTRVLEIYKPFGLYENMPFEECVNKFVKIKREQDLEAHATPMSRFLFDEKTLRVDFIGRLENFDRDFKIIKSYCGDNSSEEIEQRNSKKTKDSPYTPETARKIYDFYQEDFELLGYPPKYFEPNIKKSFKLPGILSLGR